MRRRRRGSTVRCRLDAGRHIRRHPPFFKDAGQLDRELEKQGPVLEKMTLEQRDEMTIRLEVKEM
jgi:hypothetical protein